MKNILSYVSAILAIACCIETKAQNIPDGTDLSSVPTPTLVTLPTPYNSGGNVGTSLADPQNPKLNYTRTWVPLVPVTSLNGFQLNAPDNYKVVTQYANGWGNILQSNSRGGWPQTKDIIVPFDNRSSSTTNVFLPYAAPKGSTFQYSPFVDQRSYYNGTIPAEGGTSYSQQVTPADQSIPNTQQYVPGKSFVGQSVGVSSNITWNVANEVPILHYSGSQVTLAGYYGANQLKVKTTETKHKGILKEYFDKDDKLVFKRVRDGGTYSSPTWMHTEYIYNDLGKLVCVVPPKVDFTGINILLNECYQYTYDDYGNVIKKFTPGMTLPEYFVYDRKHRLVLYRSPKMAGDDQYKFIIYDKSGRIQLEGIVNSTTSPSTWQNDIETTTNPTSGSLLYYLINGGTNSISNITNCDILNRNYYDSYDINFLSPNNSFSTAYSQYYKTGLGTVAPTPFMFVHGKLTRTLSKVIDATNNSLGGDNYTITEYYYDKKGQIIQTRSCIPWNDLTIPTTTITHQYNFAGQEILTIIDTKGPDFGVSGAVKQQTLQLTSYNYDLNNGGRIISIEQKMDSEPWRNIANYTYDEMGRVSRKLLGGVENQFYTYDIAGKMIAINNNYVENGSTSSNMPTTFGIKLRQDHGFSVPRLDGKLSGIIWRGAGASPMQSYGYEYDIAGRLAHAEYRKYTNSLYISQYGQNGQPIYSQGDNWNKQTTDYTAANMKYDKNGNMTSMTQVGVPIGGNEPMYMDVMAYFYGVGNRQTATVDAVPYNFHLDEFIDGACEPPGGGTPVGGSDEEPPIVAGKGDGSELEFFDLGEPPATPTSSPCNDYEYDANGNLTHDGNKKIDITYNHLNLPVDVTVQNTSGNNSNQPSTIYNVYNGAGKLLQKTIVDNTQNPAKTDVYKYVGAYTYRNGKLVYALHNEGRAVYVETPGAFEFDFFVKDHLGNVRTVVTAAETNGYDYVLTHELASANLESTVFAKINEVRSPNPAPSINNTQAELLNSKYDSTRIGASLLLSVMPGDALEFSADYYWEQDTIPDTVSNSQTMLNSLFSTLTGGIGGYSGNEGFDADAFARRFPNVLNYPNTYDAIKDGQTDPNLPRAYLNYLIFDKDMKLVSEQSGVLQIGTTQSAWGTISINDPITIGQGGYVLVYASNELNNDVFFDHIDVKFYKGQVKQEQNYYPYGLCIKEGDAPGEPNKFKFEGKLLQDELGLHLYDFHARQYDPQIGKFWGVDPLNQYSSGYTGMGNDPANLVDPTGMQTEEFNKMARLQSGTNWQGPGRDPIAGIGEFDEEGWENIKKGRGGGGIFTGGDYRTASIIYFQEIEIMKAKVAYLTATAPRISHVQTEVKIAGTSSGWGPDWGAGDDEGGSVAQEGGIKSPYWNAVKFGLFLSGYTVKDVYVVNVNLSAVGITGFSGTYGYGIVGNEFGFFAGYGVPLGTPELSVTVNYSSGDYVGSERTFSFNDFANGTGDQLSIGAGPINYSRAQSFDNEFDRNPVFQTSGWGVSASSRDITPLVISGNYQPTARSYALFSFTLP